MQSDTLDWRGGKKQIRETNSVYKQKSYTGYQAFYYQANVIRRAILEAKSMISKDGATCSTV